MDHTKKSKTFIAFINKDKKDKYWIHGNYTMDEDTPKVYPYDTKEEKEIALEIGKRFGVWDETSDIEAVLLKVIGDPFSIITKKEAESYHKQIIKEEELRVAERKAKEKELEKPKKVKEEIKEDVEIVEVVEKKFDTTPKITEPPKKESGKVNENDKPKRGRPKIVFDE